MILRKVKKLIKFIGFTRDSFGLQKTDFLILKTAEYLIYFYAIGTKQPCQG